MRLCSRKFPTIERTEIFSLKPGTPAFKQQIPRTTSSIFTPAQEASYSAEMISLSQREFIFAIIWASLPSLACSVSRLIIRRKRWRSHKGATDSLFHALGSEYPESMLNTAVASSPICGSQVNMPQSV